MASTFILNNLGIEALQAKLFKAPLYDSDPTLKTSSLGTPVYSNLEFPSGNFQDLETGDIIEFDGITMDAVLMVVNQTKNIVTTSVAGRNGTVKEYASDGDFAITVEGFLVGEQQDIYPQPQVTALAQICQVPNAIRAISEFLDFFEISDVVITDYEFAQQRGSRNTQPFRINMISDTPIVLQ